jgi:hypothetical protein
MLNIKCLHLLKPDQSISVIVNPYSPVNNPTTIINILIHNNEN